MSSSVKPAKIRKLDEAVINRIAAGEIIQRPANALKELLENSLDAGSTSIQVTVKDGGLKLLQIQDNGSGINKEDLGIVCERFTTSKLSKFEDLEEISTYGFRGEALASISHVAHLSIVTKTADSPVAYRAEYTDGKLKTLPGNAPNPKACAGNDGTILIAEDLFYNMDTRKKALKSYTEEHSRILDVVGRYAVHNSNVGFSVKKQGDGNVDLRTPPKSSATENIKIIYGAQIARELIPVTFEDEHFKLQGHVSNFNYSTKKSTFLLFINHRLVESSAMRKAIDSVYSGTLPKGSHPFVYLSIEINPRSVDVNVHPTKSEVHFLHEDIIISKIASTIDSMLLGSKESRTFFVQTVLPGMGTTEPKATNVRSSQNSSTSKEAKIDRLNGSTVGNSSSSQKDPRNMVRTDTRLQKLDKFLTSTPGEGRVGANFAISDVSTIPKDSDQMSTVSTHTNKSQASRDSSVKRREIRLKSVKALIEAVQSHRHKGMEELIRAFTFVGCVDRTRALIQHETRLFMVNTTRISTELFYQKALWEFGNFGRINLTEPITIKELALMGLEAQEQSDPANVPEDKNAHAEQVQKLLMLKAEMLDDYFAIKIDKDGKLRTLPLLLENYFPSMERLPSFVLNISDKVNWSQEQGCFQTFAHELAVFYAVPPGISTEQDEMTSNNKTWKWTIEFVVYPEIRKCLLPPESFVKDATLVQLANLPDLYKVFERC